MALPVPCRR